MATSSRFAVAVHILATLTVHQGKPVPSELIAKSASTNPAVIRRLLSMLSAAGLSHSQLGQGGGAMLAMPPEAISLLDVYKAVESEQLFALHRSEPNPGCTVGRHIQEVLQSTMDRALGAMEHELAGVTIADVADDIRKMSRRKP
ncbi:MAG TPA: Rrf2 family transcriptional regulator [Albitalea sp.]|nr:Rrf2 family transcriptional regulator [Albitalea sp.]